MGLVSSFAVLVVAGNVGRKAGFATTCSGHKVGLLRYMYAALLLMSLLFSGLITLQFKVRNRLHFLARGLMRW